MSENSLRKRNGGKVSKKRPRNGGKVSQLMLMMMLMLMMTLLGNEQKSAF